MYWHKSA
jgi:U3 small nucleolar RNA-associated protein 20